MPSIPLGHANYSLLRHEESLTVVIGSFVLFLNGQSLVTIKQERLKAVHLLILLIPDLSLILHSLPEPAYDSNDEDVIIDIDYN